MTPETEEKLLEILQNRLPLPADLRLWQPDETCRPFLIEMSRGSVGVVRLAQFKLGSSEQGVITSISTHTSITGLSKSGNRIIIVPGNWTASNITSQTFGSKFTGALSDAIEDVGGLDFPGIVAIPGLTRPVRIPLEGGLLYEVWWFGASADIAVSLSGYKWPTRR